MAAPKEKRFPNFDDLKKMEKEKAKKAKEEAKLDKDIYTEDKGPAPSPPDMGSVRMMAKGGAVTSRGQGKVMRKKQTKMY
jgi:hypothetical protein